MLILLQSGTQEKAVEDEELVVDGDFCSRRHCVRGGGSLSGGGLGLWMGMGEEEDKQQVVERKHIPIWIRMKNFKWIR